MYWITAVIGCLGFSTAVPTPIKRISDDTICEIICWPLAVGLCHQDGLLSASASSLSGTYRVIVLLSFFHLLLFLYICTHRVPLCESMSGPGGFSFDEASILRGQNTKVQRCRPFYF